MNKFCFLFGHRDAPESILPQIEQAVEAQYLIHGIEEFVVGHRGNFDSLAARAVRSVKASRNPSDAAACLPPRKRQKRRRIPRRNLLPRGHGKRSQASGDCACQSKGSRRGTLSHLLCEPPRQHTGTDGVCRKKERHRMHHQPCVMPRFPFK